MSGDQSVEGPQRPGARLERGELQGNLDGLTPSLILARSGGRFGRWPHAGGRAGLFAFGEATRDGAHFIAHHGFLLPLALGREPELRLRLSASAEQLQAPASKPPRWGADRGRDLQSWLDREGLGVLRLGDQTTTERWLQLALTPAVFTDVLSHFDYLTAVADSRGGTTRVLEHAPFAWRSHIDLLRGDLEDGDELEWPIAPFRLFLATEVQGMGDFFASPRERHRLFRPRAYWTAFTRPDPAAVSAAPSIRMQQAEQDYGWIDLSLTLGPRTAEITLSQAYDPLPSLLDWLQAISAGDLPIGVAIDEESSEARLVAQAFDDTRLLVAVLDRHGENERAAAVVDRAAFLDAFRQEFIRFLRQDLAMDRWTPVEGDEDVDPDAYLNRLRRHPFIG